MPTILRFRRGTSATAASVTGVEGELYIDTDLDTIRVHDGATAGGFPLAKRADTTYVGTTAITLSRASANQALTGVLSVALPGSASGVVTLVPTATAGTTTITLPATTGTVVTTGDTGSVTNTMLGGGIANAKLSNSTITVNGASTALGGSVTVYAGTTALQTASAAQSLTGVTLLADSVAPPTVASGATIAPTTTASFVSGTTAINTITAPAPIAATGGTIVLIPTGLWTTTTSGNIALATTAVVNKALHLTWDATSAKWYPSY